MAQLDSFHILGQTFCGKCKTISGGQSPEDPAFQMYAHFKVYHRLQKSVQSRLLKAEYDICCYHLVFCRDLKVIVAWAISSY